VGSVSNGGGNGDQWSAYKSSKNAGKGRLHSRDYKKGMVFKESIKMLDGTVETCHTDVVKASGAMAQKL
jgi:hypothetical protein